MKCPHFDRRLFLRLLPVVVIAGVLMGLRVAGVKSEAFQAAAHVFVGLLLGVWLCRRDGFTLALVVALSVVEGACFLRDRLNN